MRREGKILLMILFIAFLFIVTKQGPPEPKDFIYNKTVVNYSTLFFSYEIVRYASSVEIVPVENIGENVVIGFVTDPWNIGFGIVPGNGSFATRTIELTNKEDKNNEIILKAYGNISPLVAFSKNNFVLKPKESVSVDIFLYTQGFEAGNYSGEIDVISKKPIYNFLSIS